jgi:DNA-binding transcriptional MocR family regulator
VTGALVSRQRLNDLGDLLQASDSLILENDGIGDVAEAPRISLGQRFPDRVIHILSYSKALGPDLRLAVLSASAVIVEQIQSYRGFSAGWTSRILQSAGAWLLNDKDTAIKLAEARLTYRKRRERFAVELGKLGVRVDAGHGFSIFVPVTDGAETMARLAAAGVAVELGEKFSSRPLAGIRVATSRMDHIQAKRVAHAIASPAHARS